MRYVYCVLRMHQNSLLSWTCIPAQAQGGKLRLQLLQSRDIFTPSRSHVTEEGSRKRDRAAACLSTIANDSAKTPVHLEETLSQQAGRLRLDGCQDQGLSMMPCLVRVASS